MFKASCVFSSCHLSNAEPGNRNSFVAVISDLHLFDTNPWIIHLG